MNDQQIQTLCEQRGLAVASVRTSGDVLTITPASLDELPGADALATLADELRAETDARYVTLAIDEVSAGGDR